MDSNRVCVMDAGVVAANDPTLFDMVPGCEDLKSLLEEKKN